MPGPVRRGLVAGAVGTATLNAVTYLDMTLRGRAGSEVPARTVHALAHLAGRRVPGRGPTRDARATALGALAGTSTGLATGVTAALLRAAGFRASRPVGALATAAASMALTDAVPARLGVTAPGAWSLSEWATDAVPHLAYGVSTATVLRTLESPQDRRPRARASAGLLARSAALGLASGSRSTMGMATVVGRVRPFGPTGGHRLGAALMAGELVVDLLPVTPSRLERPSLGARLAAGAAGGTALAEARGQRPLLPALLGAAGAATGAWLGAGWREVATLPDWQAALLEDLGALALTAAAVRGLDR